MTENNYSVLPLCILKDRMENGNREYLLKFNDILRPNSRNVLKNDVGNLPKETTYTPYHFHTGIEIFRLVEGKCTAVINNVTFHMEPGDIYIANPFEPHGVFFPTEKPKLFVRTCLIFQPSLLFGEETPFSDVYDKLIDIRMVNFIPHDHPLSSYLRSSLDGVVSAYEKREEGWQYDAFSQMLRFYSFLLQGKLTKDAGETENKPTEFVRKVSEYIDKNIEGTLLSSDAAEYCRYSGEHFCRLFRKCFNRTFRDYVNICRIQKIKDQLDRGTDKTLTELSMQYGFSKPGNFSIVFKKVMKMTPTQYLKQLKEKSNPYPSDEVTELR